MLGIKNHRKEGREIKNVVELFTSCFNFQIIKKQEYRERNEKEKQYFLIEHVHMFPFFFY